MADENRVGRFGEGGVLRNAVDDAKEYIEGRNSEPI